MNQIFASMNSKCSTIRYFLFVSVLLTGLLSRCGSVGEVDPASVEYRDTLIAARDGEPISCRIGGRGATTLFFLHGWCIDKSYWAEQLAHFGKNYRCLAIDLPGFGESGKGRDEYSIAGYSRDVQTVIQVLGLENVVLIGHSMSGDVMLETALSRPEILAVVGVDNFKDVDVELTADMQAEIDRFMDMLKEKYTEIAPAYAEKSLFASSTPPGIRERVLTAIKNTDPKIATGSLQAVFTYGKIEKDRLARLVQPIYLINTDKPSTNKKALRKLGLDFKIFEIANSGHYPMMEQPAQFDAALQEVLNEISGVLAAVPLLNEI